MRRLLPALMVLLTGLAAATASPASAREPLQLRPPVAGPVVRVFTAGPEPWSGGHRGVDLAAAPGAVVRAAAAGTVSFAGVVAGVPSVAVDHGGGLRTTYTPVVGAVAAGTVVPAGRPIGTLAIGHCTSGCLHWGLTDGTSYFDPTAHLVIRPVRLLPLGTIPTAPAPLPAAEGATDGMPVAGRVTSRFGMRRHPITGVYKLHDGVDLAAPCGTPVRLPTAGTVALVETHAAYGIRVIVEHGGRRTGYAHLRSAAVRRGDRLAAGALVGFVGSTGLSTGCHLHWMEWRQGRLVDPMGRSG